MLKPIEIDISKIRLIEIIWRMFQEHQDTIEHYKYIYSKYTEFWYTVDDFENNFQEFKQSLIDINENLIKGTITERDQMTFVQVLNQNNALERKNLEDLERKTYVKALEKVDKENEGEDNNLDTIF
ncbi:MAG: hypothetical protein ACD_3C00081G0006 [uncultured bacterium (gcode 4)]|uniref:Uncharacterized protein n=1 Tax=uncultured bacterium (gcode 4) TaxID=1234023 RepID=K2GDH5_9BACT|nr:MAG: hypothetical protein ACD_3C00081G0006 [uncultured bacterium (gcode 4)]